MTTDEARQRASKAYFDGVDASGQKPDNPHGGVLSDELRDSIADAIRQAYQDGLANNRSTLEAWINLAMEFAASNLPCERRCVDFDPAGNTYEVAPARRVIELWRAVLPSISQEDFLISCWSDGAMYLANVPSADLSSDARAKAREMALGPKR